MAFLRTTTGLKSVARRSATSTRQPLAIRPFSSTLLTRATQGYGNGNGDPKGENPQEQGASNATKHNAEHPGPEPPSVGKGTGTGPTKAGKTPADSSAQSGGSRSKEAKETGSSPTGGSIGGSGGKQSNSPRPKSKDGASPKISEHEPGEGNSGQKDAEVEQHNRDFEKGHDRASESSGHDKVDKKFWSGKPDVIDMRGYC